PGYAFVGNLPQAQLHLREAKSFLTSEKVHWHYSRLLKSKGHTRSALTRERLDAASGSNYYTDRFAQGATIVPRSLYFVDAVDGQLPDDAKNRIISVHTAEYASHEAKKPWTGIALSGLVEGKFLFRTAISRNLLPFALVAPPLVILPISVEDGGAQ